MLSSTSGLVLLSLASSILAKTDLAGCTSTRAATGIVYWVPETGELCTLLDCGGGRAPPKTDVPGCAAYAGTAQYVPSFLPGFAGTATAPLAPAVTSGGILTDSNAGPTPSAAASSTPVADASVTSAPLVDTTSTLDNGAAATTLLTSELLFDTSAATADVTNRITVTSVSAGPAIATGNAAAGAARGGKLVGAVIGVAAGFAML